MIKYSVREIYVIFLLFRKKNLALNCPLTKSKLIKTILPGIYNFYKGKKEIYPGENHIWSSAFGSWNRQTILISFLVGDDRDSLQLPFDSRTYFFELPRFRCQYLDVHSFKS